MGNMLAVKGPCMQAASVCECVCVYGVQSPHGSQQASPYMVMGGSLMLGDVALGHMGLCCPMFARGCGLMAHGLVLLHACLGVGVEVMKMYVHGPAQATCRNLLLFSFLALFSNIMDVDGAPPCNTATAQGNSSGPLQLLRGFCCSNQVCKKVYTLGHGCLQTYSQN